MLEDYGRFYGRTSADMRQKHPGQTLRAYAPRLGKRSLTKRYDDLFEELMKYMSEDDIITREDYEKQLRDVMSPRLTEGTLADRNVHNLFVELVDTPRAKSFFRGRNVEKIESTNKNKNESYIKEGKRKRYEELVSGGHEVYRVVDQEKKTVTIVYKTYSTRKGVRKETWRRIDNGTFGPNPNKIKAKYS
jgi:hypothetical protein